jgi:hypothetical protein
MKWYFEELRKQKEKAMERERFQELERRWPSRIVLQRSTPTFNVKNLEELAM